MRMAKWETGSSSAHLMAFDSGAVDLVHSSSIMV